MNEEIVAMTDTTEATTTETTPRPNLVASVAASLTDAQVSLAAVVGWLVKEWPADLYPVQPSGITVSAHFNTLADLLTARRLLASLGDVEVVVDDPDERQYAYARATVRLGGGVSVIVQSYPELWLQAFPCDGQEHIPGEEIEAAELSEVRRCERCRGEFVWHDDGTVVPVAEAQA